MVELSSPLYPTPLRSTKYVCCLLVFNCTWKKIQLALKFVLEVMSKIVIVTHNCCTYSILSHQEQLKPCPYRSSYFKKCHSSLILEICGVEQHPITVCDTGDYVDIEYNQYRFVTVLFQACSNLQLHAQARCGKFEHA